MRSFEVKEPPPLTSQVDEYRARAAECERKAEIFGHGNAAVQDYYAHLAQHWRSMALLAEHAAERIAQVRTHDFLLGAATGGAFILLISMYALGHLWAR